MINKTSPVPLYYQIMEDLLSQINSKELLPGQKLPTEEWLCQHYDVSRVTIRKALSELVASGQIQRKRGKGNYITRPDVNLSLTHMASLHKALTIRGIVSTSKIISIYTTLPPQEMIKSTGISPSEQVIVLHRIRYADGLPISDQVSYLVQRLCGGLHLERLANQSLYDMFQEEGIQIAYSNQTFKAAPSTKEQQDYLELDSRESLLVIHAAVYNTDNEIIEYSENYYVSERYSYNIRLDYSPE